MCSIHISINDHLGETMHLTAEYYGVYLLLLNHYSYHGYIPDDPQTYMRIGRSEDDVVKSILSEFFVWDESVQRWHHEDLDDKMRAANARRKASVNNGKKGGRPQKNQSEKPRHNLANNLGVNQNDNLDVNILDYTPENNPNITLEKNLEKPSNNLEGKKSNPYEERNYVHSHKTHEKPRHNLANNLGVNQKNNLDVNSENSQNPYISKLDISTKNLYKTIDRTNTSTRNLDNFKSPSFKREIDGDKGGVGGEGEGIKLSVPDNSLPLTAESKSSKSKKNHKHVHGEYKHVRLSEEQYAALLCEWGAEELNRWIRTMDEGIELKGYKYKNHALALRNWRRKEQQEERVSHSYGRPPPYSPLAPDAPRFELSTWADFPDEEGPENAKPSEQGRLP